jgi:hypothetical protein
MATYLWPFGNNKTLEFTIYDSNSNWNNVAGLYIFTHQVIGGSWHPLYIGQTDDFSSRLPSHERLNEAVRRGATHIHAAVIPLASDRDKLEKMLVQYLQPTMNDQLKGGLVSLLR